MMKPEGGRREARGWRRAANAFTAGTAEMGLFLHGGRLRGWEVSARLRGVCGRAEIIRPHFKGAGGLWGVAEGGHERLLSAGATRWRFLLQSTESDLAEKCPPA